MWWKNYILKASREVFLASLVKASNQIDVKQQEQDNQVFITSNPGQHWNFHSPCLFFTHTAITQHEWNPCTCLGINLFSNKFHLQ